MKKIFCLLVVLVLLSSICYAQEGEEGFSSNELQGTVSVPEDYTGDLIIANTATLNLRNAQVSGLGSGANGYATNGKLDKLVAPAAKGNIGEFNVDGEGVLYDRQGNTVTLGLDSGSINAQVKQATTMTFGSLGTVELQSGAKISYTAPPETVLVDGVNVFESENAHISGLNPDDSVNLYSYDGKPRTDANLGDTNIQNLQGAHVSKPDPNTVNIEGPRSMFDLLRSGNLVFKNNMNVNVPSLLNAENSPGQGDVSIRFPDGTIGVSNRLFDDYTRTTMNNLNLFQPNAYFRTSSVQTFEDILNGINSASDPSALMQFTNMQYDLTNRQTNAYGFFTSDSDETASAYAGQKAYEEYTMNFMRMYGGYLWKNQIEPDLRQSLGSGGMATLALVGAGLTAMQGSSIGKTLSFSEGGVSFSAKPKYDFGDEEFTASASLRLGPSVSQLKPGQGSFLVRATYSPEDGFNVNSAAFQRKLKRDWDASLTYTHTEGTGNNPDDNRALVTFNGKFW